MLGRIEFPFPFIIFDLLIFNYLACLIVGYFLRGNFLELFFPSSHARGAKFRMFLFLASR